jgi:hypothetical protein
MNDLKNEILNSESVEDQLSILKKYNLISQDVNEEELKNGMFERAEDLGFDPDTPVESRFKLPILIKLFNKVNAVYMGGVGLNLGLKPLIKIINLLPIINLPTIDFIDVCGGLFGVLTAKGLLFTNTLITFPGMSGFVGFVGYRVRFPFLMHTYSGFSALTFGLGLGMHIKESNWNQNCSN